MSCVTDEAEGGKNAEKQEGDWGSATETDWAEAAAVAAAQLPTSSGAVAGEEGQGWNWPWGPSMHGGFPDADALLDDDFEGKLPASCNCSALWVPCRTTVHSEGLISYSVPCFICEVCYRL